MLFKAKQNKFTAALINMSQNLQESADYFAEFKAISDYTAFADKMKEYELKGDSMVHEVSKDLTQAFITPIEREDILQLTNSMDDILDGLENCSSLIDMYTISNTDQYILNFIEAIKECTYEIAKACKLLTTKNLQLIPVIAIKIKDLESHCDEIQRQSIKQLFTTEKNPIRLIQYKEMYESLEDVADDCQRVANILVGVDMKNA